MFIIRACAHHLGFLSHRTSRAVSSLSQRIQGVAKRALSKLLASSLNPFHPRRAQEGRCAQLDQSVIALWQKSLNFAKPPDRRGLDLCLNELRSEAQSSISARNERFAHHFNNKALSAQIAKSLCDHFGLAPTQVADLEGVRWGYQKVFARLGDRSWPQKRLFDPLAWGNLPYTWTSLRYESNATDLIRMPAVTRDLPYGCQIAEEFAAYIDTIDRLNHLHLYVNLMDKRHGNEKMRSRVLDEWVKERNKMKKRGLILISLDKNSPHYSSGLCGKSESIERSQFKERLFAWLRDPLLHHWPIKGDELDHIIKEAIDRVEGTLKLPLRVDQRSCRAFLDFAQSEMLHRFLAKLVPQSMNISCKNCIDRGPAQQVLLSSWLNYLEGQAVFDADRALMLLAPAWLVSGRAMQRDRFDRCISALEMLVARRG